MVNTLKEPLDLEHLTVKRLTAIFRSPLEALPNCINTWPKKLGVQGTIPLDELGPLIHSPVTTTKDIHSWFKCILHRGMAARRVMPKEGNSHCRLCDCYIERIEHFAECSQLRTTFDTFRKLLSDSGVSGPYDNVTVLLGCVQVKNSSNYAALPSGLFTVLLVLWKFIILSLTEVDTSNSKYSADRVWTLTLTRIIERLNAAQFSFQARARRANVRGLPPPKAVRLNKALEPIARIDKGGQLSLSSQFHQLAARQLGDRLKFNNNLAPVHEPAPSRPEPIAFVKASS